MYERRNKVHNHEEILKELKEVESDISDIKNNPELLDYGELSD